MRFSALTPARDAVSPHERWPQLWLSPDLRPHYDVIVGAWSEEPNALVLIGEGGYNAPNLKATQVELRDGLTARVALISFGAGAWKLAVRERFIG